MSTEKALSQARANIQRKATHFGICFSSVSGAEVIKALKAEFGTNEICKPGMDQTDIIVRAAQADVITYIELMMNYNEVNNDVD